MRAWFPDTFYNIKFQLHLEYQMKKKDTEYFSIINDASMATMAGSDIT